MRSKTYSKFALALAVAGFSVSNLCAQTVISAEGVNMDGAGRITDGPIISDFTDNNAVESCISSVSFNRLMAESL